MDREVFYSKKKSASKTSYWPIASPVSQEISPRRCKGGRNNFQIFTATDFIAVITQHIPEKSFQLVRYYGRYSNRGRGEREKQKAAATALLPAIPARVEIIDVSEYRPQKIPSPQWRECFKRVWEVNPLVCPKCGNEMKIISFINEADVIRR
jgi:hypothetical protein